MTRPMVAPEPVFRSVDRPHLVLDPTEDVWPCESCEGQHDPECFECQGWGLVHGYGFAGQGCPVALVGWVEGTTQSNQSAA